jgi:aminopeptidase-like protein
MGGAGFTRSQEMALLWVLNLCDGAHSLLDIAERASLPFASIRDAASLLEQNGLIRLTTSAETIAFAERANADR